MLEKSFGLRTLVRKVACMFGRNLKRANLSVDFGPLRTFDLQSFAALQLPQSRRSFIAQHFGYPKLGLKGKNEGITVFYECPLGNGRRNGFIPEDRIVEVKIRQQPKKQISPKCYLVGSPMCAHTLTSRLLTQRVSEKG